MSKTVVKAFTDQLDEVRLLKRELSDLHSKDPFELPNQHHSSSHSLKSGSANSEEHSRILRLGYNMIDNIFSQMHDLISKAKTDLKATFRTQLVHTFQLKFQKQTEKLTEHIDKLETYLSQTMPELELLRNQGKHQVLAKQMVKTEELRNKTRFLKDKVSKTWQKSGNLVQSGDL